MGSLKKIMRNVPAASSSKQTDKRKLKTVVEEVEEDADYTYDGLVSDTKVEEEVEEDAEDELEAGEYEDEVEYVVTRSGRKRKVV